MICLGGFMGSLDKLRFYVMLSALSFVFCLPLSWLYTELCNGFTLSFCVSLLLESFLNGNNVAEVEAP